MFRECGEYLRIIPLILAISCTMGCIESGINTPFQEAQDLVAESENSPPSLEIDFSSEVGRDLFRTEGDIVLWSSVPLPYLVIDAKLQNSSQQIDEVRYIIFGVQPSLDRHFEISKNRKISPGIYNCTLEISGPEGLVKSETRRCMEASKGFNEQRPQIQYIFITQDEKESTISDSLRGYLERRAGADKPDGIDALENRSDLQSSSERDRNSSIATISGGIIGSTSSNKYHRLDCRYAIKIKPENRVYFANTDEALNQGYQPCRTCNP